MRFTARELRNKDKSLLRRLQRKLDSEPYPAPEEDFSELFKHPKKDKHSVFEEPVFDEPKIRKQTRLNLYKSRQGGRK